MLIPNKGRLVVKPFPPNEKTGTGIVAIRLNVHETARQGEVLAVGEGVSYQPGQIVIFPPFAGDAFRVEQDGKFEELRILRTDSILATL